MFFNIKKIFILSVSVLMITAFSLFSNDSVSDTKIKKVYVGVYLTDVSNFDLTQGRFNSDLILWCKWLGNDAVPPISFANGEIDSMDEISKEKDGSWNTEIGRAHV